MPRNHAFLRLGRAAGLRSAIAAFGVIALSALTYAAVSTKVTLDRRMAYVQDMLDRSLANVDELATRVNAEQDFYLWITPPDPDYILRQPIGLVAFHAKGFPAELTRALVPAIERGCPVYTVIMEEDPVSRDLVIHTPDGKAIYAIHPYKGYDPYRLLNRLHPDLSAGRMAPAHAAWLRACYDPARVQIVLRLMPSEYVEAYAENRFATLAEKAAATLGLDGGGGVVMMRSLLANSNLVFDAITQSPTGTVLEIGHPTNFAGRVEVYVSTDLVASAWAIAVTNLATNGSGTIYWTDTGATNAAAALRFYAAANGLADSDGDGLVDGRERFLYHTTATNRDTDADGLVDGYSRVVSTNAYPAGAKTNGGQYVEGELTWRTSPTTVDTDDDGMGDGWEVSNGHNPTNWNNPPNVRGTVTYAGRQTGSVWVIATTTSNSWVTNVSALLPSPGAYRIPHLEATNYWVKAWMDSDNSSTNNASEARGTYAPATIVITNRVLGINFALTDPDGDNDSLPDWWEVAVFGGTNATAGTNDLDGDLYTNLEEYQANTVATNAASHPWNISGTIIYTGPQTGTIHVIACPSSNGWVAAQATTSAGPGAYTITHLPPNADYWVKAWRDTSGEATNTFWEAWGTAPANPIYLGTNATGVDVTLLDPDTDSDSLPDWWEVKYGLDPHNGNGANAAAWWRFDEGQGTNIQDSTANANHGVLYNAPSNAWTQGVMSNALTFNGTNTYVQFQNSASLTSTEVSVSLWIKPAHAYTNGTAVFFSKKDPSSSAGYRLSYEQGSLSFLICAAGNKTIGLPCALTNGVWHHVVGTYGGPNQRLYLNGVLLVSTNYNWDPPGAGNIAQSITAPRIGASTDATPANYFAGVIDDARVYSHELGSNEVHAIYDLGADPDGDGLSNFEEYRSGGDPWLTDTDGDGLSDYAERFVYGTSPAKRDTDGDGMDDDEELLAGTNPLVVNGGASAGAIRYYYDPDDRISAAYSGAGPGGGAGKFVNTPAGNATATMERRTP